MAYKDPDKQRAYQNEWIKRKMRENPEWAAEYYRKRNLRRRGNQDVLQANKKYRKTPVGILMRKTLYGSEFYRVQKSFQTWCLKYSTQDAELYLMFKELFIYSTHQKHVKKRRMQFFKMALKYFTEEGRILMQHYLARSRKKAKQKIGGNNGTNKQKAKGNSLRSSRGCKKRKGKSGRSVSHSECK